MPSIGTVIAAVLFVDFNDAPATNKTPEEAFNIVSPTAYRTVKESGGETRSTGQRCIDLNSCRRFFRHL